MKQNLLWMVLMMIGLTLSAQGPESAFEKCGSMENLTMRMAEDPTLTDRMQAIETATQNFINQDNSQKVQGEIYTIPVVVHVVQTNITVTEAQINSQMDVLNEDLRRLNSDTSNLNPQFAGLGADSEIEFCLAVRDPDGLPHSGITYTTTSTGSFGTDDGIKFDASGGKDAWPSEQYMNMWVGPLTGGLLGYAQFPGGDSSTDGVVITTNYFGTEGPGVTPASEGRTATHEVGHWLNLRHVWGDGGCDVDDFVSDTPNCDSQNWASFPTCTNISQCGNTRMIENYMDYSDDGCMNLFTIGQKNRMRALFNSGGFRFGLTQSQGCIPVNLENVDAELFNVVDPDDGLNLCTSTVTPSVVLRNYGNNALTSTDITLYVNGIVTETIDWTGNLLTLESETIPFNTVTLDEGQHILTFATSNPNGSIDQNSLNDAKNVGVNVRGINLPIQENFDVNVFPAQYWSTENPDNNYGWAKTEKASYSGEFSAFVRGFEYDAPGSIGEKDELILPLTNIDLFADPVLTFWLAYARFSPSLTDLLELEVSSDCGVSWENIYSKEGVFLQTTTISTNPVEFIPTADDWREETLDLSDYISNDHLYIKFVFTNANGQNLYIDDIKLSGTTFNTSIEEFQDNISIVPNPVTDRTQVSIGESFPDFSQVQVSDMSGRILMADVLFGMGDELSIDLSIYESGVYFVQIKANNKIYGGKIVKM